MTTFKASGGIASSTTFKASGGIASSPPQSIPAGFFHCAMDRTEKTAFVHYETGRRREISYGELSRFVLAASNLLEENNFKSGDRIVICAQNSPFWCIAYLAASSVGAVCVPVDSELDKSDIASIIQSAGASIAFADSGTILKVAAAPGMTAVIDLDAPDFRLALENYPAPDSAALKTRADEVAARISSDDLASIIFTSGTTGKPKGVMLTHGNFCADAHAVARAGIVGERDKVVSLLPLHHTYPFTCAFLLPILGGATVVCPPGLKGSELAAAIKDNDATVMVAVPRLLEMFLNAIETKLNLKPRPVRVIAGALRSLNGFLVRTAGINAGRTLFKPVHAAFGRSFKLLASGGAKLAPEIMTGLESLGFTVLEGYGLTETSPVVAFNPNLKRKPGSVGIPVDGAQISTDAQPGREGEILIKGPMVMKGYYRMPEETALVLTDGWFRTGDLGQIDSDGYLFITGRLKEMIVLGSGKKVYPEELEKKFAGIALIKEICVYEQNERGGTLHAIVVPDMEYAKAVKVANLYEVLKWEINAVAANLPDYMRIKGFKISVEALPRTRLGKLRRFMMRRIADGTALPAASDTGLSAAAEDLDETARAVLKILETAAGGGRSVMLTDNLELDLGLDSLQRLETAAALERRFGMSVDGEAMSAVHTAGELVEMVRALLKSGNLSGDEISPEDLSTDARGEVPLREPSEAELYAAGYRLTFFERLAEAGAIFLLRVFFGLFFGLKITGFKNLPEPPFILCPNHASYLDSFIVASMLPASVRRKTYFQGAKVFFDGRFSKRFGRAGRVIPIDPDAALSGALSVSAHVLRQGGALCVFPEGGRTFDGSMQPFMKGFAILALRCGAKVVPVGITGSYDALPRHRSMPAFFKRITVNIGRAMEPSDIVKDADRDADKYRLVADKVRAEVEGLSAQKQIAPLSPPVV
jgi:long-chain acyl-CoA synthetase